MWEKSQINNTYYSATVSATCAAIIVQILVRLLKKILLNMFSQHLLSVRHFEHRKTRPCGIIHFINIQNLNDIHPKTMNTENFCRILLWYKRWGVPIYAPNILSTSHRANVNTRGPFMAHNLSDLEGMN